LHEIDLSKVQNLTGQDLRRAVENAALTILANIDTHLGVMARQRLVAEVADEILGFGPIEPLLADATVSEVMINGPRQVYVERRGLLTLTDVTFRDNAHVMRIIEKIISPLGRRLDEASPMVDARLPDGSRVNAIIPPLALDGPTITIRKFSKTPLGVEDLIRLGTITSGMAKFLEAAVQAKQNIVVSGGTGTGKTTFLNVLSGYIPSRERVVTIEDPAELQLRQPHVVRLETRPPNMEGKGEIGQRLLLRNALRMRPDRIVVGEVRGPEAFDMLQAMNTGHDGSLTTVHSNSPRDAISRIENLVLTANLDLPIRAVRDQIASAVNLVVQLNRLRDGTRRVTHISEVLGMESDVITIQDIFLFRQTGIDASGRVLGTHGATGLRPRTADKAEQQGISLPADLFATPSSSKPGERRPSPWGR
jgi:pilus assembly protein CpaF